MGNSLLCEQETRKVNPLKVFINGGLGTLKCKRTSGVTVPPAVGGPSPSGRARGAPAGGQRRHDARPVSLTI